jgi:hypothetical protein
LRTIGGRGLCVEDQDASQHADEYGDESERDLFHRDPSWFPG